MNKENIVAAEVEEPPIRITRSRAKALGTSEGLPLSLKPPIKRDKKRALQGNSKRAASDENKPTNNAISLHRKRRAVLKDVTNVLCENSYMNCVNAANLQPSRKLQKGLVEKNAKEDSAFLSQDLVLQDGVKSKIAEQVLKTAAEVSKPDLPLNLRGSMPVQQITCGNIRKFGVFDPIPVKQTSAMLSQLHFFPKKDEYKICNKSGDSDAVEIVDVDSNHKDPQMCSLYAPEIYNYLRVTELERRPSANYMETVQQDITQGMRGVLVDWLVEVSEEYRLVPDTLYLTVNLIDRFLSRSYIEKQKLQLLGVSCMLIASKYEEICAPHVEELCFITANTYTKEEVVKMESQVLNFLHFQLSVPTTKTFLRRFVQTAKACCKVPCIELEFLANYLAELTLVEYCILKFTPSLIAASALLLARWTLDQSEHPWNPMLEHYTNYSAPELKATVLAIQGLQLNTNGCPLSAIREKYKQSKYKCVSTLSPSEPAQSLF